MKNLKILYAVFFVFMTSFFAYAAKPQQAAEKDWRVLLEAQNDYDNLNYSSALQGAVHAKNIRVQNCDWAVFVLNEALTPYQVRKAGDVLSSVLPVLRERRSDEAVGIIQALLNKKTSEFFDNSIKQMVAYIAASKVYPEADYLCGKVYQIEGEYDLAMNFYDSAVKNSDYLDIPETKYEILYTMADMALQQKNLKNYEEYLLNILNDDTEYFKNTPFKNALLRTIDSQTDKAPVEKFFLLYRADSSYYSKAYYLLSKYYQNAQEFDKAVFASSLSSLTLFTHIYKIIKVRNPKYVYSDLSGFFAEIQKYKDITDWSAVNNLWDSFLDFAQLAKIRGDNLFATQLLTIIEKSAPDEYWKKKAFVLLNSH